MNDTYKSWFVTNFLALTGYSLYEISNRRKASSNVSDSIS